MAGLRELGSVSPLTSRVTVGYKYIAVPGLHYRGAGQIIAMTKQGVYPVRKLIENWKRNFIRAITFGLIFYITNYLFPTQPNNLVFQTVLSSILFVICYNLFIDENR